MSGTPRRIIPAKNSAEIPLVREQTELARLLDVQDPTPLTLRLIEEATTRVQDEERKFAALLAKPTRLDRLLDAAIKSMEGTAEDEKAFLLLAAEPGYPKIRHRSKT